MSREKSQRSWEATPSLSCAAALTAPIAAGVAAKDAATSLTRAPRDAESENARVRSPSAISLQAVAPIAARRPRAYSSESRFAAVAPVEADIDSREATEAPKRKPLAGDLIRRRWRSLIGRHPPKTLSHALMDRILAWREQVAEVGDISPRCRAILTASLAGKAAGAGKDGQAQNGENRRDQDANRHRAHAPIRVGTALIREHAGVLHRVMVVAEGFEWEGRIYASLSAVACAITGVRWNGRRFFALERGARQSVARKTGEQGAGARRASPEPNAFPRVGGSP